MSKRLESDRPCMIKQCRQTLYFDEVKEQWMCKGGHVQDVYGGRNKK